MCVLQDGLEIGSQGSQGVSDLSPLSKAACPPTAVGNKELAGVLMDDTGGGGGRAVKVPPSILKESPRSREIQALGQGETSRFSLGEGRCSSSWPSRPHKPAPAHWGFHLPQPGSFN